MTDYYVDPDAVGANTGLSWTDAWTTIQSAFDNATTAGDIVYCRGTQTITAELTMDTSTVGTPAAPIKYIGCNPSTGAIDGSRFVIDASTNVCHGINVSVAAHYMEFEHFELASSAATGTNSGIYMNTACHGWCMTNVYIHGWTGNGVRDQNRLYLANWTRCKFSNNTYYGYDTPSNQFAWAACEFSDNGSHGAAVSNSGTAYACIFRDNGGYGVSGGGKVALINCIIHANTSGGAYHTNYPSCYYGCRITGNQGWGISDDGSLQYGQTVILGCYFDSNASGNINTLGYSVPNVDGSGTSQWLVEGSDTDYGYVDSANDDYNLDPDNATLFNKAITFQ